MILNISFYLHIVGDPDCDNLYGVTTELVAAELRSIGPDVDVVNGVVVVVFVVVILVIVVVVLVIVFVLVLLCVEGGGDN